MLLMKKKNTREKEKYKYIRIFSKFMLSLGVVAAFLFPTMVAAQTTAADTTPPETPGGFRIEQREGDKLRFNWNWTTDVGGYVSQWEISYLGKTIILNHNYPGDTINVSDLDLNSGNSYTFGLRAIDTSGNKSGQTQLVFETTPPTSPTNLRLVSYDSYGNPDLISFDAGSDNAEIRSYEVFLNGQSIGMTTGSDRFHQFSLMEQVVIVACQSTPRGTATVQLRAIDSSFNVGSLSTPLTVVFPD